MSLINIFTKQNPYDYYKDFLETINRIELYKNTLTQFPKRGRPKVTFQLNGHFAVRLSPIKFPNKISN